MNLMFLDARALQTRLRGAKDSPGLPVGPGHPGALLPAKIRLELLFAIRRFSSPCFKKFGRNMRGDVREMEFRFTPRRGKLLEVAQNPLGGFGRIDDDEGLQRFDRPRALGLLCRGAAAVPAGYGCERGMSGCCHGVAPSRVLPWAAMLHNGAFVLRRAARRRTQSFGPRYKRTIAAREAFQ